MGPSRKELAMCLSETAYSFLLFLCLIHIIMYMNFKMKLISESEVQVSFLLANADINLIFGPYSAIISSCSQCEDQHGCPIHCHCQAVTPVHIFLVLQQVNVLPPISLEAFTVTEFNEMFLGRQLHEDMQVLMCLSAQEHFIKFSHFVIQLI